ncbi:MAG: GTP-binding protein, partial [Ignavibacteriales bacterium]|nr:GTP-binding protein [Ignavibacteriales bacterium]
ENAISQIDELLSSYSVGKVYRDGVRVVLAGAPNVGKSSLLNALLRENRAIVTDIPGTTRDTIEETITIDGLMFNITDTAGLRDTTDPVEREGVRRTDERIANCDLLLLMFDLSRQLTNDEDTQAEELIKRVRQGGASPLLVLNKMDIKTQTNRFFHKESKLSAMPVVRISAKTTEGLSELKKLIVTTALHGKKAVSESGITITNARHYSSLLKANESLKLSLSSLTTKQSGEFIAVDLRAALDSLGEIIGIVTTDDILNRIFSTFCIGK